MDPLIPRFIVEVDGHRVWDQPYTREERAAKAAELVQQFLAQHPEVPWVLVPMRVFRHLVATPGAERASPPAIAVYLRVNGTLVVVFAEPCHRLPGLEWIEYPNVRGAGFIMRPVAEAVL